MLGKALSKYAAPVAMLGALAVGCSDTYYQRFPWEHSGQTSNVELAISEAEKRIHVYCIEDNRNIIGRSDHMSNGWRWMVDGQTDALPNEMCYYRKSPEGNWETYIGDPVICTTNKAFTIENLLNEAFAARPKESN